MNYFELFEIPVHFKVNVALLSKKFFELSRAFHPDYFATASDAVKAEALEKSALLNKAWKTFQNVDETIRYVLQINELIEEEEKYALPPDFLMEVMEINEELMEAEVSAGLQSRIDDLQIAIYDSVKKNIETTDARHISPKEMLLLKDYYYKKKYLDRIRKQIAGMQ